MTLDLSTDNENAISFFADVATDVKPVMKITRDGIWVDPDLPVNDAAKVVLAALDENIQALLQQERERCVKAIKEMK